MSDLNKILALHNIMPYLKKEECEQVATAMGLSLEEVNKRLTGKNKEDEFIIILITMNVLKSIAEFNEGVSQIITTATSDLLVELKNGKKFMLEIKHTDKEKYSISGGNLRSKIAYAENNGFDLYFAISIKGYWMLFNAEYIKNKNGKITVADMTKSELDQILNCVSYIFPKGLQIKTVYSKNTKKTIGIQNGIYGNMISYEMIYNGRKLFRVKGSNSPYIGLTVVLSALQDRLSMEKQIINESNDYTRIIEEFTQDFNSISEYKFLLAPIEHTVDTNGERYDAHKYLEIAKAEKSHSNIELNHIRRIMQWLANEGVDIKYLKNNIIYQLKAIE